MKTELQALKDMLDRAGVGYGLREDHNPSGTAVRIEPTDSDYPPYIIEMGFDEQGRLKDVAVYVEDRS